MNVFAATKPGAPHAATIQDVGKGALDVLGAQLEGCLATPRASEAIVGDRAAPAIAERHRFRRLSTCNPSPSRSLGLHVIGPKALAPQQHVQMRAASGNSFAARVTELIAPSPAIQTQIEPLL